MAVRIGVMVAALFIIPNVAINRIAAGATPERIADRILDRYEAGSSNAQPANVVDRLVRQGPRACGPLLRRLGDPATRPGTRAVIHDALVKLNGSDLGEAAAAWDGWCFEVRRPR
jgi:hypothetical protein